MISSLSFDETVDVELPLSLLKILFGLEVILDDLRFAFFKVSTLFSMSVLMTASSRAASRLGLRGKSMHKSSVETALSVIFVPCQDIMNSIDFTKIISKFVILD